MQLGWNVGGQFSKSASCGFSLFFIDIRNILETLLAYAPLRSMVLESIQIQEDHMAERKLALKRAPERPELQRRIEIAKTIVVTEEHLREQRASFIYGNAPFGSGITKESALKASTRIRVTSPTPD